MSLLALIAAVTIQSTWYVDAAGSAPGDGTVLSPFTSISFALSQPMVVSGDTISVAPGHYLNETMDFGGKNLGVIAIGGASQTIVSAPSVAAGVDASIVRLVSNETAAAYVEGFTFRGGLGTYRTLNPVAGHVGGAFVILNSSCTIRSCVFEENVTSYGGAIYAENGNVVLSECTFRNVTPITGPHSPGFIAAWAIMGDSATILATNCQFDGRRFASNRADLGAVYLRGGVGSFEACTFLNGSHMATAPGNSGAAVSSDNAAIFARSSVFFNNFAYGGGALCARNGSVFIADSRFERNTSGDFYGGALALYGAIAEVEGTEFVENSNYATGGAIHQEGGGYSISRCVFSANRAVFGGAIWGGSNGSTLRHCIFERNEAGDGSFGGAGAVRADSISIDRSTFVLNSAPGVGAVGGSSAIRNCILWGNGPSPVGMADVAYSIVEGGWAGVGNINRDPSFWSATDLHLLPDSPARDAGDPAAGVDPDGTRIDLGAFGFDPWHCGALCTGPIGSIGCISTANSSGQRARISALGSLDLADNRLVLNATQLPPNTVGFALASRSPGFQWGLGGGPGVLCLSGPILRFSESVLSSGGLGLFSMRPNLAGFPQGQSVTAGDTWHFQFWFRDQFSGASSSNTSDAVQIQF